VRVEPSKSNPAEALELDSAGGSEIGDGAGNSSSGNRLDVDGEALELPREDLELQSRQIELELEE